MININGIPDSLLPVGISKLGTIVQDNVVFPAGSYIDLDNNIQTYDEFRLDSVSLVVNRSKQIVISDISGRNGSVKEYVTNNDFEITLNAVLAPPILSLGQAAQVTANAATGGIFAGAIGQLQLNLPIEDLIRFSKLERVPQRVAIRNKFLSNNFGVNFVVISDFTLSQLTADSYRLRLNMLSDFGIDLMDFG